ncbi:methyltransferase domain-containing protein [Mycolicibacterium lutetiense]
MQRSPFEPVCPNDYLIRLANSDLGKNYKAIVTSMLALQEGNTVVDLGCGPGADLTTYAEAVGPSGVVIGIDQDETVIGQAQASTSHLPNVSIRTADIHRLPLESDSVDHVHTDRVLQHVFAPAEAISEAARVLRRSGKIVCAEPDWATLAIDHPETAISRAYTQFVVEHVVRNATIGRALPRLLTKAGLAVNSIIPVTTVFTDAVEADQILGFHRVTVRAVAAGYLTDDQARRWLNHLESGPFFGSATLFIVTAQRPG